MSDKGRDRATQLVVVEVSVDFTKHKLLSSAHKHEQSGQRKRSRWPYKNVTEPLALQRTGSTPLLLQLKFRVWQIDDCQQPRPVNVWFNASASAAFIV